MELVLSQEVINRIRIDAKLRQTLVFALKVTEDEIFEWAGTNSPDSKLTNVKSVSIIQAHTGFARTLVDRERVEAQDYVPMEKRKKKVYSVA